MESWLDPFAGWMVLLAAAFSFSDFLLSGDQKRWLKLKTVQASRRVGRVSYSRLILTNVDSTLAFLTKWFGETFFSKRRFFMTLLVVSIPLLVLVLLTSDEGKTFRQTIVATPALTISAYPPFFLSFGITVWLLNRFHSRPSAPNYIVALFLDILAFIILSYLSLLWPLMLAFTAFGGLSQIPKIFAAVFGGFFRAADQGAVEVFLVAGLPALPTVIHLVSVVWAVGARFVKSIVFRILSLLFLRVYESRKGVLTLIGVGVAGAGKLIQQAAKAL